MVQEVLAHQGLDSNWISVVTNHVQGTKKVIKTLIHEMEQINLAITSSPNNQVAAAEDAKMLHKDVLEIFDHYHNIEREIKEIHLDNTLMYGDLKTFQDQLKDSQVHTGISEAQNAMNEVLSQRLESHDHKILALEEEVDTLAKENM